MSRKFLDDNIRTYGTRADLPGSSNLSYNAGHEYQDRVDATIFRNEGTQRDGAIFRAFPANGVELIERFTQRPLLNADILITATAPTLAQMALIFSANRNFEVQGTNMTGVLCTHSTGGGITLTTAGADEDQAILAVHADTSQTLWATVDLGTDDRVVFETTVVSGASIADTIIWAGLKLTNDNVVVTDAEQAFLRYENGVNSGRFQLITSDNGVDVTTNTTLVVEVSTSYHIKLVVNGDRDVNLYINGILRARVQTALGTGHDLLPFVGVEAGAVAAKAITVRGLRIGKDFVD